MYNLSVDGNHNFFVGDKSWLVHNATVRWPCALVSTMWKSKDASTQNLANHLEDLYPGHVTTIDADMYRLNGTKFTDWDIMTSNSIIEVKTGAAGFTTQVLGQAQFLRGVGYSGRYMVYAPKISGFVEKELRAAGITVVKDLGTLEKLVKP